MKYKVNEIFFSLQGEGFNQGKEVIFIRLSGCNLSCVWCDTKHEDFIEYSIDEILSKISIWNPKSVILTGGEPTIHNLEPLLRALKEKGYWVGIESNGTKSIESIRNYIDYMSISPKANINQVVVDEVRILNDNKDIDYLLHIENLIDAKNYYLSPLEINNQMNIQDTMKLLGKINELGSKDWRISLQLHKFAGIK